MIEPLEMDAHVPGLLRGDPWPEQATAKLRHLHERYKALAELKAATLTQMGVLHRRGPTDSPPLGAQRRAVAGAAVLWNEPAVH